MRNESVENIKGYGEAFIGGRKRGSLETFEEEFDMRIRKETGKTRVIEPSVKLDPCNQAFHVTGTEMLEFKVKREERRNCGY